MCFTKGSSYRSLSLVKRLIYISFQLLYYLEIHFNNFAFLGKVAVTIKTTISGSLFFMVV